MSRQHTEKYKTALEVISELFPLLKDSRDSVFATLTTKELEEVVLEVKAKISVNEHEGLSMLRGVFAPTASL